MKVTRSPLNTGLANLTGPDLLAGPDVGDPIELTVRGYELSIRRDEAANVEVTDVRTGE